MKNKSSTNNPLPIGVGQFSNQSNLGYSKLMQLIQQNKAESNYRINTMFLNNSEKQSWVSKESGSVPTFTFQNEENSFKSLPVYMPLLNEPNYQNNSFGPNKSPESSFM